MQSRGSPAGATGVAWTGRETCDLIAIWGETLQRALSAPRKSIPDGFQRVAEQMAGRGHRRLALECRAKIAALRLEYRRVFAHNSWSFGAPRTCPYYQQLDRILDGDGLQKPVRILRSMDFRTRVGPAPLPTRTDEVRGPNSATSAPPEVPISETVAASAEEANKTVTEELLENPEPPNRHECQNAPTPPARNKQEVVDGETGVLQFSPTSCLANARPKRRCVSGLNSVGERTVAQPSKQREEVLGAREKGHKEVKRTVRTRRTAVKK